MKKPGKPVILMLETVVLAVCLGLLWHYGEGIVNLARALTRTETPEQTQIRLGDKVRKRLEPYFKKAGAAYPPQAFTLLAFKKERRLELWAEEKGRRIYIRSYSLPGVCVKAGPKLKEGDRHTPEGIYRLISLNPNGWSYLTMEVNYPNAFDREIALKEGRCDLGGGICIHGGTSSAGCLAVGNPTAEELFILTAQTGLLNTKLIIAPRDFRAAPPQDPRPFKKAWIGELYRQIERELEACPRPRN